MFALVDWEGECSASVVPLSMISGKVGEMCWVQLGKQKFRGEQLVYIHIMQRHYVASTHRYKERMIDGEEVEEEEEEVSSDSKKGKTKKKTAAKDHHIYMHRKRQLAMQYWI